MEFMLGVTRSLTHQMPFHHKDKETFADLHSIRKETVGSVS